MTQTTAAILLLTIAWGAEPLEVDPALLKVQERRIAMLERISPAVVAVFDEAGSGGGSGVLISADGYALSNFHVTGSAGPAMKCGLNDGNLYDAVIVGIDPVGDVALIKLLGRTDFPTATMGNSDRLQLGENVYAVGNPFLLATDFTPTVTMGIVSGLHRYQYPAGTLLEYTDCIQTDASINPGNSGGPLFNDAGELVGINGRGSFEKRGRVSVGVGYAISINQIKNFLDHLRGGLIVDHATLGATVTTDSEGRVVVDQILTSADAYRRGLRPDDEVVSFGGRPIGSVNQFKNVLGIYPKGWPVELTYRRDERKTTIVARLLGVHREGDLLKSTAAPTPPQEPPGPDKPQTPKAAKVVKSKIPEAVSAVFEKKTGFANYYFNKTLRDRLLAGLLAKGDFSRWPGVWKLNLDAEAGGSVEMVASEKGISWKVADDVYRLLSGENDAVGPPGAPGMLMAIDHYRRLLLDQTKWFSRFEYSGGLPGPDGDMLLTLEAERGGVVTEWLFDRDTGELRGLRCHVEENGDPCELWFADYRPLAKRPELTLPHRWEVRVGGKVTGRYVLKEAELSP